MASTPNVDHLKTLVSDYTRRNNKPPGLFQVDMEFWGFLIKELIERNQVIGPEGVTVNGVLVLPDDSLEVGNIRMLDKRD